MKIDNIPQTIDPTLNLEQVREECLELVKKRAYMSAGVAIIPIPFLDVLIDVGILSQLIPEVNARFGLAPEQVTVFDPKTKQIHWSELKKRGVEFSGLVVARTAMKKSFNNMAAKYLTKQVTKFIPLGGQMIAASLGYIVMKKVAEAHVEESYKLAKGIQLKQGVDRGQPVAPPVTNVPTLEQQQDAAQK
ncbi:hypothetical protein [uncultured Acinetobacter sp.]|uniref:hypothetical protein n=1 Tax=uncultured Acinetobacter sp. TaxID=165433 RepID=UPI00261DA49E|nr:hypothetical protein [uncultured Acinetobacter sp.]